MPGGKHHLSSKQDGIGFWRRLCHNLDNERLLCLVVVVVGFVVVVLAVVDVIVVVGVVEPLPLQELLQNRYGWSRRHPGWATENCMRDFVKGALGDGGSDGGILGTFLSCWPKIIKSSLLIGRCGR